jgi:preprotein translocase subunit SecY
MKRFLQTIKNIWSIEDLRGRILTTLGLILIYRVGSYVVLPGVDSDALAAANAGSGGGITDLINLFAGGAFSRASIFALGIMPYISASIVIQLLGMAIPYFQKLQKEGESGRRKINQITRYLTIAITAMQAPGYIATQVPNEAIYNVGFWSFTFPAVIILVTGTMFVMWLGERITEKGIGNGISLLIMIGIIANLPFAFTAEFASRLSNGGMVVFLIEMVALILVVIACIMLVQGTRKIPVHFAKRIVGKGSKMMQQGGVRQYIPLKVNAAGVMPIIFAQAIMFVPITLAGFSDSMSGIAAAFADFTGFWYNFTFALLCIAFTYFYTAVTVNPNQIADDLKRNGGFIPGVKPGKRTSEFIDNVMSRITLPGSIFLAFVAILPAFAGILEVNSQFAQFFGGTSLLIMVGVVLDTLQPN